MSPVRYFEEVPHIGFYGMHDEENEVCWISFMRNGVQFTIDVKGKDIHGTPFYEIWRPCIREKLLENETPLDLFKVYDSLFQCVILQSMDTLKSLAPDREYWTTIKEYLHTPWYRLRIAKDEEDGIAKTTVTEGPVDKPAYHYKPHSTRSFKTLPDDVPFFSSDLLVPIHPEKTWRVPPGKVKTNDSQIFYFEGCEHGSTMAETGEEWNPALDSIKAYLKLHEFVRLTGNPYPKGVPRVIGIVTDTPIAPTPGSVEQGEPLVAGILLSWIRRGVTLANVVLRADPSTRENVLDRAKTWKSQAEDIVKALHQCKLCLCSGENPSYINENSIMIDSEDKAWVCLPKAFATELFDNQDVEAYKQRDLERVRSTFEVFVVKEMSTWHGENAPKVYL